MTNLSDLLPAGAASKQLSFTASGAISSGQTVGLNSDGTVSPIVAPIGAVATFETGAIDAPRGIATVHDTTNNRLVVAYIDDDDGDKGKVVVGVVSGTTITYGSIYEFNSADTEQISMCFDPDSGKCIVAYRDQGNSSYGTCRVLTVSGTTVSMGSEVVFESANVNSTSIVYDTGVDRVLIAYNKYDSNFKGYARAGQVSGTSVAFAAAAARFDTDNTSGYDISNVIASYDTAANKTAIFYRGNNQYLQGIVASISGTTVSYGTVANANSDNGINGHDATFDATANKHVVAFANDTNSAKVGAVVATVSGTSISFGSIVDNLTSFTINTRVSIAYSPDAGTSKIIFGRAANDYAVETVTVTVSGTSLTGTTPVAVYTETNGADPAEDSLVYDTTANAYIAALRKGTTDIGISFVFNSATGAGVADFLGIADAAISNAASGKITMKGGIATNSQLLPLAYSASFGSEVVFESADTQETAITYDTTNDKIVIFYRDGGNSDYGTAVVGTVSGTSISFGTPVVYQSAATEYNAATFDSANGKVVVACKHQTAAAGKIYVGTVSGTSISFGSSVEFEGGNTTYISATYDSANGKVVLSFVDESDGSKGKARVGTVSGTSISFGGEVTFNNANTVFTSITYDSNAGKVLIAFRDAGNSNYGTGIVGTVSGTSISFGSETVFESARSDYIVSAYDSSANKVVIVYADDGNSDYITSVVATVSGTSVSFGDPVVISSSAVTNPIGVAYDSNSNKTFVTYQDGSNNNYGAYALGTVSGTSISFTSSAYWAEVNATKNQTAVYDPDQQKVVIAFRDGGNSNYGTGIVGTVSGAYPNLVPNTTYYVQDDGTLSTTSSSVTAGKAMSTNSINLDYSS